MRFSQVRGASDGTGWQTVAQRDARAHGKRRTSHVVLSPSSSSEAACLARWRVQCCEHARLWLYGETVSERHVVLSAWTDWAVEMAASNQAGLNLCVGAFPDSNTASQRAALTRGPLLATTLLCDIGHCRDRGPPMGQPLPGAKRCPSTWWGTSLGHARDAPDALRSNP